MTHGIKGVRKLTSWLSPLARLFLPWVQWTCRRWAAAAALSSSPAISATSFGGSSAPPGQLVPTAGELPEVGRPSPAAAAGLSDVGGPGEGTDDVGGPPGSEASSLGDVQVAMPGERQRCRLVISVDTCATPSADRKFGSTRKPSWRKGYARQRRHLAKRK